VTGLKKIFSWPRAEDVTNIDADDLRVSVTNVTEENREYLVGVALAHYLEEQCKYCLRVFDTLESLNDAVWAGAHGQGRIACENCWKANNDRP
jgi:hypothetical protein